MSLKKILEDNFQRGVEGEDDWLYLENAIREIKKELEEIMAKHEFIDLRELREWWGEK